MSNPVSLHVEDQAVCLAELGDQDVIDCERDPKLRDYLKDAGSDMYTFELSELYRNRGDALKYQPADRIMNIILWSWVDEKYKICDIDMDTEEKLSLDLAISPTSIQELGSAIKGFNPNSAASLLFGPNEIWETEAELADYLQLWSMAFQDALSDSKGLYYKIWV